MLRHVSCPSTKEY